MYTKQTFFDGNPPFIDAEYLNGVEEELESTSFEEGTSGDWIYRKWNSGVAECWTTQVLSMTGSESLYGGKRLLPTFAYTLPSGVFLTSTNPTVETDASWSNGTSLKLKIGGMFSATLSLWVPSSTAPTVTGNLIYMVKAIGRWR